MVKAANLDYVCWAVEYPDGRRIEEPLEGLSIKAAPPGVRTLELFSWDPEVGILLSVNLERLRRPSNIPLSPVVMRVRSVEVSTDGTPRGSNVQTDRFIYGGVGDDISQAVLWTLDRDGRVQRFYVGADSEWLKPLADIVGGRD